MKEEEFQRIIEEIGVVLNLTMPTIIFALDLYKKYQESNTHKYKPEVFRRFC